MWRGTSPPLFYGDDDIKILAIDQARHGAYSIFDYENKKLLEYDEFNFESSDYTYPEAILKIETLIQNVIKQQNIGAVFVEDIHFRQNIGVFKNLAHLQGVLMNLFEKNEYLYALVAPSKWQGYCNARSRTAKEKKSKTVNLINTNKKTSKALSIQFVKDNFGVDTNNDNIADAISIGWYVVNNIKIKGVTNE